MKIEKQESFTDYCVICQDWAQHSSYICPDVKCKICAKKGHVRMNCPNLHNSLSIKSEPLEENGTSDNIFENPYSFTAHELATIEFITSKEFDEMYKIGKNYQKMVNEEEEEYEAYDDTFSENLNDSFKLELEDSDSESQEVVQNHEEITKIVKSHKELTKVVESHKEITKSMKSHKESTKAVKCRRKSTKVLKSCEESRKAVKSHEKSTKLVKSREDPIKVVLKDCKVVLTKLSDDVIPVIRRKEPKNNRKAPKRSRKATEECSYHIARGQNSKRTRTTTSVADKSKNGPWIQLEVLKKDIMKKYMKV